MTTEFALQCDARGLNCPLPILKAKKALQQMQDGEFLHVMATDKGALQDFQAFSQQTGHELLNSFEREGEFHFFLKKKKA